MRYDNWDIEMNVPAAVAGPAGSIPHLGVVGRRSGLAVGDRCCSILGMPLWMFYVVWL